MTKATILTLFAGALFGLILKKIFNYFSSSIKLLEIGENEFKSKKSRVLIRRLSKKGEELGVTYYEVKRSRWGQK
jgi:hypothetical protein